MKYVIPFILLMLLSFTTYAEYAVDYPDLECSDGQAMSHVPMIKEYMDERMTANGLGHLIDQMTYDIDDNFIVLGYSNIHIECLTYILIAHNGQQINKMKVMFDLILPGKEAEFVERFPERVIDTDK